MGQNFAPKSYTQPLDGLQFAAAHHSSFQYERSPYKTRR